LGVVIANHAINPSLYAKLPYDTARDFVPVTLMAQYPYILTIHPSLPAKSVRDLIALAKARPGQLSYASSGIGSGPHLGMELFKSEAKIDIAHVPYKGASPANTDLLAGQVQVMFDNFLAAMPFIASHRLRVLAVTSAHRSAVMPGLPTIAESGLPGFDVTSWYGVIAPAGTPDAIISKVQGDIAATLRVPAVHDRLAHEGAEPVGSTPAQFAKLLADEMRKWSAVVKAAHVKPESY
jgi:tripartite-type tricarboxylate transporter receptor subunit TctC